MPQPLSKVKPDTHLKLGPQAVEKRPELSRLIGEIIARWSATDMRLSQCLCHLIEGSASHITTMYLALRSAQGAALRAAAESILPEDDYQLPLSVPHLARSGELGTL